MGPQCQMAKTLEDSNLLILRFTIAIAKRFLVGWREIKSASATAQS
jgi:hypothetical protein